MSSLGKLFGAFDNLQNDLIDGAVMTAGAVTSATAVSQVLGMKVGDKTVEETLTGFLPAGMLKDSAIPVTKIVLGAVGPGLLMGFLPRNAWLKKFLDGGGIGLALSGWFGLFRALAPAQLRAQVEAPTTAAILGLPGGYGFGGAQVGVEYLSSSGMNGAAVGVEEVSKFGGIGNQPNRYATILGA